MPTEQEAFWAGQFGDEYTVRMGGRDWIESNIAFFSEALAKAKDVKTILELGCNKGLNLAALEYIDGSTTKTGVDINAHALHDMATMFEDLGLDQPYAHCSPIASFETVNKYDLVFTKGVLIHIAPEQLPAVYQKMLDLSNRYILVAEYYNPTPVEVKYRGNDSKLFKRDFWGDLLRLGGMRIADYGFVWRHDEYPQDDIVWALMEKV